MKKLIVALLLVSLAFGSVPGRAAAQEQPNPAEQKRLFKKGAKLWPVYCSTCHNARPPSEKAPYEWKAIASHMRTLGNLPADDYRALAAYLEAR
jgi:hypothetical protein